LNQIDNGIFIRGCKTTLGEYLGQWLRDYVQPNLAPKTYEGRAQYINRQIVPSLGKLSLIALKPEHLQRFYAEKLFNGRCDGKAGLSARTVRDLHGILHAALATAVKHGLLVRNVADAVDPPRFSQPAMHVMNELELMSVLEAARPTGYYALFYTLLFTGMRRSEALALRWGDADLIAAQISINRSMHHLATGEIVFRQPKTAGSRRMISLSPSSCLMLRQHRDTEEALKGTLKDHDLIFAHVDGSPLLPSSVTHSWMKLVRRCGLTGIRLHDCRHTHASLMLKQGIHPKIVQERLGHSRIRITLDTYSHVTPGLQRAAAESFDTLVNARHENVAVRNH
ncbi:tyrosine-type recombinase/integrase, partial [Chloroflexota bacterium]